MTTTLNLLITYQCNYSCKHCISDCGPNRKETMNFDQAKKYIDSAVKSITIGGIGYTGGEPFVMEELMTRLMDYSFHTYGLPQGVVTNCFWAKSSASATGILQRLYKKGLRNLTVSCDTYHLQFAHIETIRNAVKAALDLDISICINITVTHTGHVAKQDILPLLFLDEKQYKDKITIKEFGPLMIGRAARTIRRQDLIVTGNIHYFNGPCEYVMNVPSVTPNGAAFACCCFGDAEHDPDTKIGYIGNAEEIPLGENLSLMENNLLFNLITQHGPYTVLELVRSQFPDIHTRTAYFGTCDVCVELYHNNAVRAGLFQVLKKLSGSLMTAGGPVI